ncbi:MAG: bifunctional folylpolyglutamate synthase/dihydrofolate synthase [Granulosicoccus sp.]|nr:bifunctional folylpolyglutamate synthase/dihydrofolate synthase [Granulosicoccus sp.]
MIPALSLPADKPEPSAPLDEWLAWLETIHPVTIDMGLDRVGRVADRLGLRPVVKPLILVGGTNGKGSTVAMLSAIYSAAGYRVGAYTSPHIVDFRERICIDGRWADSDAIVAALDFVESGRAPDTLTYFEYTTLAAMHVFQQSQCDVYVLEVGLGGRLDATNLWEPDCSVITSIALDHEEYLGSDVNVIATEKAAIGRTGRTLVLGEPQTPASLFDYAACHGITVNAIDQSIAEVPPAINLTGPHQRRNAWCAMAAVDALQGQLPVQYSDLLSGLKHAHAPARFERLQHDGVDVVMDVAHNPAGAHALCLAWQEAFGEQQAEVIFSVLADKDLGGIVRALEPVAGAWHCIELDGARATPLARLGEIVARSSEHPVNLHTDAARAWQAARQGAIEASRRVLVAGSFHTIARIHELRALPVDVAS